MTVKRLLLYLLVLMLVLLPAQLVQSQEVVPEPAAYAVLFYSPTCPHCHTVINNHLPPMQDAFGEQFQVIMINVTTEAGSALFYSACDAFDSAGRCGGVPMMAIGETLLFGSLEIPQQMPRLVTEGLANGGLPVPDFPGMESAFEAWLVATGRSISVNEVSMDATTVGDTAVNLTLAERLAADPEANAVAVVVLIGLVISLGVISWAGYMGRLAQVDSIGVVLFVLATGGALLAVSLVSNVSGGDAFAQVTAWGILLLMGMAMFVLPSTVWRERLGVPLIVLIGGAVAVYLAYIETTETSAVCGAIGNCNAVQQSDYAQILGVPIGVIGVVGYAAMLLGWVLTRRTQGEVRHLAYAGLLLMAFFGVVFSSYLTFLEPFVIGATCVWCLMSAVAMLLLFWVTAPDGWQSLNLLLNRSAAK